MHELPEDQDFIALIGELLEDAPRVLVVVPSRDEERYIRRCLVSLTNQSYPVARRQITVVDNGSRDQTGTIAAQMGARVLPWPNGLVGSVRNAGARSAPSDIIAFLDGDCLAQPDWLFAAVRLLQDQTVGVVGGDCVPDPNGTWVERSWAAPTPGPQRDVKTLPGATLIMRRSTFDDVGGFDEGLSAGEDDELCVRIRQLGYRIVSSPNCSVTHLGYPSTLLGVARRQVWHGAHQLSVVESIADRQLLLTHSFLIGTLLLLIALPLRSITVAVIAMVLIGTPVIVLAVKKSIGRKFLDFVSIKMIPIASFFYVGRSIGLVRNYAALVAHWTNRNTSRSPAEK